MIPHYLSYLQDHSGVVEGVRGKVILHLRKNDAVATKVSKVREKEVTQSVRFLSA